MSTKRILTSIVYAMTAIGLGFSAYPFIASLSIGIRADNASLVAIQIPQLSLGELHETEVNGMKLFFLKPTKEQSEAIRALDSHVWDTEINTFNQELGSYIYWGYSTKWGCPLELKEPQESAILRWNPKAEWFGGYWDRHCEVSYDYAGRAIKSYKHTYNGYTPQHPNLKTPRIFKKQNDKYVISIYQR